MSVNIYNKAQDKLINVSGSSSISTKDENGLEVIADAGEEGLYVHLPFDFKYDPDTNEYGYIDKDGVFQTFSSGIDFIAPEFNPETPYEKGDYCMRDGILRVKTADTRSRSPWNPADWRIEKLSNLFASGGGGGGNGNLISDSMELSYLDITQGYQVNTAYTINSQTLLLTSDKDMTNITAHEYVWSYEQPQSLKIKAKVNGQFLVYVKNLSNNQIIEHKSIKANIGDVIYTGDMYVGTRILYEVICLY